jgi:hypothetical protein
MNFTDQPLNVYPVGVLEALLLTIRAKRLHLPAPTGGSLRHEWGYIRGQAAKHNWRAVRSAFNGYLAEHGGHQHSAGRGWTKRAAIRRAERICRDWRQADQVVAAARRTERERMAAALRTCSLLAEAAGNSARAAAFETAAEIVEAEPEPAGERP